MKKEKSQPAREIDKSNEQIIKEKIESKDEIGFLWFVYDLAFEKRRNSLDEYLDFINNENNKGSSMKGYLNFLDSCLDKYNYYKNKKGLDKKAAKFYSIREHIKYAKKEFSGKDKVTY